MSVLATVSKKPKYLGIWLSFKNESGDAGSRCQLSHLRFRAKLAPVIWLDSRDYLKYRDSGHGGGRTSDSGRAARNASR